MVKKEWMPAIGEVGERGTPMDTDELMRSKISERKRREIERQEELDDLTHTAKVAELEKKTKSATAESEKVERRAEAGQEGPIKMTGSIDLGHISITDQMVEAKQDARAAQETLGVRVDAAEARERESTERAHTAEKLVIQTEMNARLDGLEKTIASGTNQKSLSTQLGEIRELASELGFSKPDPTQGGSQDAGLRIQLMQLTMQEKREEREFKWQMRQDEKKWNLEMARLNDDRGFRQQEAERQKGRDSMIAGAPEMVGAAIAKGLMDREATPQTPRGNGKSRHIEAEAGQAGTTECECGTPIAIGPTAKLAVCAECGNKYSIKRIQATAPLEEDEG